MRYSGLVLLALALPVAAYMWSGQRRLWGTVGCGRSLIQTIQMTGCELTATPVDTIPELVEGLRRVFLSGKTRCVKYRRNQLKQLCFLVHDNEQAFVDAIYRDLGRPKMETVFAEILGIKNDILTTIANLNTWTKDQYVYAGLPFLTHGTRIRKDPKGTVLVLGAWNYPITVQMGPVIGALAAGNTVVLKPSELSMYTAQLIANLWPKYMDPNTSAIVNGGIAQATALLDERFEHIFYTGSGRVGRIVAEKAARWLCPTTLELGGKSPVIIDASADLKIAARRTLWAKAFNAGQTCIAPDYVLVERQVQDKFIQELVRAKNEFWASMDKSVKDFGRIVNENHWERLHGLITSSKAEVVMGGTEGADQASKFIPLTVLNNVNPQEAVMKDEIFGPILPIVPVDDVKTAVQFINGRDQPLALYIFTGRTDAQEYILTYTRSGGVVSGDMLLHYAIDALPFGGTGPSGYGAYHGKAGFDCFTHERAVVEAPSHGVVGHLIESVMAKRYPPYSEGKLSFFRHLLSQWILFGRPADATYSSTSIDQPMCRVG